MKRLLLVLFLLLPLPAHAVMPDEILADPALEQRARQISVNLRCLVCQNQSIDDSDAPLARDLRLIVRERLSKGDSDAQVLDYLVMRYGNFILLKPPFQMETLLLWLGPALALLAALAAYAAYFRRRKQEEARPLSEAERRQLEEIVKEP